MLRSFCALSLAMATGCFSSWAITQAAGGQRILDEGVRERSVPLPNVYERLLVAMPLVVQIAPPSTRMPFRFRCEATQSGRDAVYHSAFRYGKRWKIATAMMFVAEAAIAAAYFFGADQQQPGNQLAAGAFAIDAVGTGALVFAPRKEIYRRDELPVTSHLRSDCPAGLVFEIAGETFPVDAAGGIGELGEAALDGWMQTPGGPIRLSFEGKAIDVRIGYGEQCTWNRSHHPDAAPCPRYLHTADIQASLDVPMGTLTRPD